MCLGGGGIGAAGPRGSATGKGHGEVQQRLMWAVSWNSDRPGLGSAGHGVPGRQSPREGVPGSAESLKA